MKLALAFYLTGVVLAAVGCYLAVNLATSLIVSAVALFILSFVTVLRP